MSTQQNEELKILIQDQAKRNKELAKAELEAAGMIKKSCKYREFCSCYDKKRCLNYIKCDAYRRLNNLDREKLKDERKNI